MRFQTKVPRRVPDACCAAQACWWAKPPTKKKSGSTWRSQVATKRPFVKPMGLVACGPSSRQMMIVKTQCQATTTSRLKARTKSTNGSRSAPVDAPVLIGSGEVGRLGGLVVASQDPPGQADEEQDHEREGAEPADAG